jgi:hypothetical protein
VIADRTIFLAPAANPPKPLRCNGSQPKSRIAAAVVEKDHKRWLDRDLAIELWDKNTKATHNSKVRRADPIEPPPADAAELKRRVQGLPDDAIPDLNESRARREHYQAELSKLQVTQQRGELVLLMR